MKIRNKIELSYYNLHFNFDLRGHLTIIDGDTSSGKSMFCELLTLIRCNDDRYADCQVFSYKYPFSLEILKALKNKLIIIDNGDILLNEGIVEYIAGDYNNQYIIIARQPFDFGVSPNYYAEIQEKDNKFYLEYFDNAKGWY